MLNGIFELHISENSTSPVFVCVSSNTTDQSFAQVTIFLPSADQLKLLTGPRINEIQVGEVASLPAWISSK